jgi:Histidine kinase-like ATPase domain
MDSRVRTLYKIKARPEGPGQARRIITEELSSRLPPDELDDIRLMVSELVTQGILHSRRGLTEAPVMLDLCVGGDIRCGVLDHGRRSVRRAAQGEGADCRLRLRLIEALADRWGMQSSPHVTELWFERGPR